MHSILPIHAVVRNPNRLFHKQSFSKVQCSPYWAQPGVPLQVECLFGSALLWAAWFTLELNLPLLPCRLQASAGLFIRVKTKFISSQVSCINHAVWFLLRIENRYASWSHSVCFRGQSFLIVSIPFQALTLLLVLSPQFLYLAIMCQSPYWI